MPRIIYAQTNFTAGEISPRLLGRTDVDRYANACETLENALPVIHGGVTNKYGTRYVVPAKYGNKKSRLFPFVFSFTQAYVLEFGNLYMRVFTNSAQVLSAPLTPYEVVMPYTEAELFDIDYTQSADTMLLFHQSHPIYRLRRFADASWDATVAPIEVTPFDEVGDNFATSLTLSLATVGTARTATASGATFLISDVGRSITYLGGTFKITGFTSTTVVSGDITTPFASTAVPVSVWTLTGTPQSSVTPSAKDPVGAAITLTGATDTWRTTDVGKFVSINGGTVEITSYVSTLVVNGVIRQVLTGVVAAPADAWVLKASVWSAARGYPRCGTFYQQRLVTAGSLADPNDVWGSKTGQPFDFTIGLNDDDAFTFSLSSDQFNPARHLASGSDLIALTNASEFSIRGGVEKAITPTNIQVDNETNYGSGNIKPIRIGKELVSVQRSGTKLRAYKYYAADAAYDSTDLTAFAEHITETGLVDMSYAQEPDPILYNVRNDGVLATMTFSREQNVVAFARWTTDGLYESVATIPTSTGDQTWGIVQRTINGVQVRYVEIFEDGLFVDCGITGTSGPGATVWAGLTHLEGKTVSCVADGADMGDFAVAGGQITLPRNAFEVMIGLPISPTIKPVIPEFQTGTGTAQGQAMSSSEISVRVLETQQLTINGKLVPFRSFGGDLLDEPPPTFTGIKAITNIGWGKGTSDVVITAPRPFRFHVLSIIRTLTVNSGGQQ